MKYLLIATFISLLGLTGCELNAPSQGYKNFVKEHGTSSRYYCDKDTGFFMKEDWWQKTNRTSSLTVVVNDLDQPTRCGDVIVNVNETTEAYTGEW